MNTTQPTLPDRLAEIRARLDAATPGPHVQNRYDHGGGRSYVESPRQLVLDVYEEGDREFYFHAPADIAYLLSALTSLQQVAGGLAGALEVQRSGYLMGEETLAEFTNRQIRTTNQALARYDDWQRKHGKAGE